MTQGELELLIVLELVRPTRRSTDGTIAEYELTGTGRILAAQAKRENKS